MLLHMLVVLMFGTATIGGARRGDGWLGPLDVTLRQLSPERGSGFTLAPGAETQPPGAALLRHTEGVTKAPVASKQVTTVAPPETSGAAPPPVPSPPPAEVREAVPEISLSPRSTPADALPRLDRTAPEEVDKPLVAPALTPPKVAPPAPEREVAPRDFTLPPMAPLERIVPPKVERQLAPPIELRPREVPVAPRAPPVEFKPIEETPTVLAPIDKSAPAKVEREQAPTVDAKPRDVPVDVAPTGVPGKPPAARTETPASGDPQRLRFGAPSVEDEIFGTKRDAPAAESGAPPTVTVESMKRRAREIAAEGSGSRGVLNMIPPPPVAKRDKLAEDIAKAAKPDCRTAYAGLGILAVVPLVASSVGNNGGCNW